MDKRIVVAGCRNYNNYEEAKAFIDDCISDIRNKYHLIFVSGGCRGADVLGEKYAKEIGFPVEVLPANWEKFGRAAGPKRNIEMARIGDLIICFWDGKSRGTKSMIQCARKFNKPTKIKFIT